jgi:hypothetical protein
MTNARLYDLLIAFQAMTGTLADFLKAILELSLARQIDVLKCASAA